MRAMLAIIRFYQFRTAFISLPVCLLAAFVIVFVLLGALYASGALGREGYVAMMLIAFALLILIMLATLGLRIFVRTFRRVGMAETPARGAHVCVVQPRGR